MATSIFKGTTTHVIYAEDTAWGTPGTPAGSGFVDKVTNFSANITNSFIRSQGIGEGRNASAAVTGNLDVNGSMEWELTDPDFLQYCYIGAQAGTGTAADPYEVQEANAIGYAAGEVNTLTLEVGMDETNAEVSAFNGVVINNTTLTATQGEIIKMSADWIGRTVITSTTAETYVGPTLRPFTFIDGSMSVGSDVVANLVGFTFTCANNFVIFRSMGSRLISQPVPGIRRYDFTATIKFAYDTTASILSGTELQSYLFKGIAAQTTPFDGAEYTPLAVSFDLVEGAVSGDRVVNFDLENCYFESWSEPIALEDGVIEVTINGFGLSGLTDGANKVPVRWWTVT